MSYVLYYSKYCDNCKKIIHKVGRDKIKMIYIFYVLISANR